MIDRPVPVIRWPYLFYLIGDINKMNPSRNSNAPRLCEDQSLLRINEILNSILTMNAPAIEAQRNTCSKIVGQLLHNDMITHLNSFGALKLFAFELILYIAQESSVLKPRLSLMENAFGNNKKVRLTASLRNNLASINQVLEEMIWQNSASRKRVPTEKGLVENSKLYQNYLQFKALIEDFDQTLLEDSQEGLPQPKYQPNHEKILKNYQKDHAEELQQNEALIEQLEEIVAKKEKRIKELNEQLQESIIDQKQMQDLVDQVECRNSDLKEQIQLLNTKLSESDNRELQLTERINDLQAKIAIQEKQITSFKKIPVKTEVTPRTRFTIEDFEEDRKQFRELFESAKVCQQCEINEEKEESLRKFLLTQALSIEAMI